MALTTQAQRRHLKQRLEDIAQRAAKARWRLQNEKKPEPAAIKHARKVIKSYEAKRGAAAIREMKRRKLTRGQVDDAKRAAESVFLFGTPEQALAAVEKFAKLYPYGDDEG
jgi:hypothetical protein